MRNDMSNNTTKYKVVPSFTGGYDIIAINNTSWKVVAGPYLEEAECRADLELFRSGNVVDNDKQNKNYNRSQKTSS